MPYRAFTKLLVPVIAYGGSVLEGLIFMPPDRMIGDILFLFRMSVCLSVCHKTLTLLIKRKPLGLESSNFTG